MKHKLQVIDFFCGAGGFSEGFRQQGFEIVMGIDNWIPAIETHNLNHDLTDTVKDVLDFETSIDEIEALPDTAIIVGSPPCALFSLSNKGGKADKSMGIRLIESFLRVIAVKKHKPSSKLQAWFMENVPNSKNYIRSTYTFRQLNLTRWAKTHDFDPEQVALNGSMNGRLLNTADFGVSQKRERFVCGEIVSNGRFPNLQRFTTSVYRSIGAIKRKMPAPNSTLSRKTFVDPNYPSLQFRSNQISDHFYDSGIYENQWRSARDLKINHPYMGRMSFPEDQNNPSRTIMATRSMTTREALIYKSEYNRYGDGEYRLPTIREIATLMGFPYSYQFSGSENTKWKQIGNAVCPPMSSAFAKSVRLSMGLRIIPSSRTSFPIPADHIEKVQNLNTFGEKKFDNPPKRKSNARFRRHPFKDGNMTVALTNFNPAVRDDLSKMPTNWYSSLFMGTGKDFIVRVLPRKKFKYIGRVITAYDSSMGNSFIAEFDARFGAVIGNSQNFQEAYVLENPRIRHEPGRLIDEISEFILGFEVSEKYVPFPGLVPEKVKVPIRQVLAMYAINKLIS